MAPLLEPSLLPFTLVFSVSFFRLKVLENPFEHCGHLPKSVVESTTLFSGSKYRAFGEWQRVLHVVLKVFKLNYPNASNKTRVSVKHDPLRLSVLVTGNPYYAQANRDLF
jgi:hypothetical protein